MIAKAISLAVIWVMTTYATGASADEKPITAQEFAQLIVDNTLQERREGKKKWNLYAKQDGTAIFEMETGWKDSGKWEVKDDKFCWKWKKIRKGKYYCIRDFKLDGDNISYYNEAGKDNQTQIRVKGISKSF